MSLYNCKAEIDRDGATHYRFTKFNPDLEVESTYLTTATSCECPGFERRHTCRHLDMLPRFLAREAVGGLWLHDFERNHWHRNPLWEPSPEPIEGAASQDVWITWHPEQVEPVAPSAPSPRSIADLPHTHSAHSGDVIGRSRSLRRF